MSCYRYPLAALVSLGAWALECGAEASEPLEEVSVSGRRVNLIGQTISASEGVVSQKDIDVRAMLRTGELLELVPGMVVTQHSGTGKANQYFLRGFNLDHGTDFATFYDHMPVNMRTHGHGQGYTDLNFVIPELIARIDYKKGPYYADVGDFSGAGGAHMMSLRSRDQGLVQLTAGEHDYYRLLALDSVTAGGGDWLWALESTGYEGPWTDIDEDLHKLNAVLKTSRELNNGTLQVAVMGYTNRWNSADQIPERAVAGGLIDPFGSLDTNTGGESDRYSFSLSWESEHWLMTAYLIDYNLNLWSNFTYFLDDPVNGDQFEQVDDRKVYGGEVRYTSRLSAGAAEITNTYGFQTRVDDIAEVGLYKTRTQERIGVVRSDSVDESSAALYWNSQIQWTDRLKTILGLRYDYYDFEVTDKAGVNGNGVDLSVNSGSASDDLASAKASIIYALNDHIETYLSAGQGLHSNDARGTTIAVDPVSGDAVDPVDPLVRSHGGEIGVRGFWQDRLNMSVALWYLDLDSELLFVGDAGNTEASRASERRGVELTGYYRFNDHWTLDLEYAYTQAEFDDGLPDREIPGAVEDVVQLGLSADYGSGPFGSVRVRYFGPRPLEESGSITSDSSTIMNLRAGYRLGELTFALDVLNLLDSDDHDIDYFYESQLAGEAAPVEDIHYHILEPRTVRLSVGLQF